MKLRMITVAVLVALLGMLVAPMQTSAAPKPTGSVPIPVTGDGSFVGQFNLERLVATDDGLAAVGDLLGEDGQLVQADIVWPIDLEATDAANTPAATEGVAAAATCEILNLVLGPLDLNLLGLRVQLSQVILLITGETEAGALLANLLCGLFGLLDGVALLGAITDLLGQINDILSGGLLGALTGLLAIIGGAMLLDNFTRSTDQIFANGTLGGQAVSTPPDLAATRAATGSPTGAAVAAASCEILNLVLGPLDLNLLGLRVQLNQVVLNITAEPGAGNLLGNLLCAVTNLLNGPSPLAGLTNQLNHILRVLGGA
jgi:hypothetical protein